MQKWKYNIYDQLTKKDYIDKLGLMIEKNNQNQSKYPVSHEFLYNSIIN